MAACLQATGDRVAGARLLRYAVVSSSVEELDESLGLLESGGGGGGPSGPPMPGGPSTVPTWLAIFWAISVGSLALARSEGMFLTIRPEILVMCLPSIGIVAGTAT
jgi:hypothetical protein